MDKQYKLDISLVLPRESKANSGEYSPEDAINILLDYIMYIRINSESDKSITNELRHRNSNTQG